MAMPQPERLARSVSSLKHMLCPVPHGAMHTPWISWPGNHPASLLPFQSFARRYRGAKFGICKNSSWALNQGIAVAPRAKQNPDFILCANARFGRPYLSTGGAKRVVDWHAALMPVVTTKDSGSLRHPL